MASTWTRNYDNLFSLCFGCNAAGNGALIDSSAFNTFQAINTPSYATPVFRRINGSYCTPERNGAAQQINAVGMCVTGSYIAYIANVNETWSYAPRNNTPIGVCLGGSDVAPTIEDYDVTIPLRTGFSCSTMQNSFTYSDSTHKYTQQLVIPIAYSGTDDVTIKEFGIYVPVCSSVTYTTSGNSGGFPVLVYHETLSTPITLSQNDTLQVTFRQSIVQPHYTPYPIQSV